MKAHSPALLRTMNQKSGYSADEKGYQDSAVRPISRHQHHNMKWLDLRKRGESLRNICAVIAERSDPL
jgi:hypothetical protein